MKYDTTRLAHEDAMEEGSLRLHAALWREHSAIMERLTAKPCVINGEERWTN